MNTQNFWKVIILSCLNLFQFDIITEKELLKIADTGDILLFRGKALGSKITRTFTSSHFGKLNKSL